MRSAETSQKREQAAGIAFVDRRRGACPTLSRPMQTGDGLLVRLRPSAAGLSSEQLIALALAARRHGNGLLDITARGNLQIRGLSPATVAALTCDIDDAGIVPAEGIAIEVPPLAGYDPTEILNPLPLAAALRAAIDSAVPPPVLAPKLSVIIDGGGQLNLRNVVADIRLTAEGRDDGIFWRLALAGDERGATPVAVLPMDAVVGSVMGLLQRLSSLGPMARGRDLIASLAVAKSAGAESAAITHPAGMHVLSPGRAAFGAALAFGQIEAETLIDFVRVMQVLGATEFRLAPEHALLVLGLPVDAISAFAECAEGLGLRADPLDKGNHVAVCSGKGACASALIDTKATARQLIADAPSLLDGSLVVHVSGCAKGCARPATAPLTLVGAPTGYGLVVNGPASAVPSLYIDEKKLVPALSRLDALVRSEKQAGESARACLTRLGAAEIITAVQQG